MALRKTWRRRRARKNGELLDCPTCNAHLDAGTIPRHSIVICSRCCAPLLWDGAYSIATAEDLAALGDEDRAKLATLVWEQRVRLSAVQRSSN